MIKSMNPNTQNDKSASVSKGWAGLLPKLRNFSSVLANGFINGSSDLILRIPIGLRINPADRNLLLKKQIHKSRKPLR